MSILTNTFGCSKIKMLFHLLSNLTVPDNKYVIFNSSQLIYHTKMVLIFSQPFVILIF